MVSLVSAARELGRVREISGVLARNGFGELVSRLGFSRKSSHDSLPPPDSGSIGLRIRKVLEELGPSFVKLGQIASTRSDLLPAHVIAELRQLQDNVPPLPFDVIRGQLENELASELSSIFESIEEEPLAAGSIAQVHRAKLKIENGTTDVVLKVQRPGIARTIAADLDLLYSFASLLERTIPEMRAYSPVAMVTQFERAIESELDFIEEAENARRFTRNFINDPKVRFPAVYRSVSTRHVLTQEYVEGLRIDRAVAIGFDATQIAKEATRIIVQQIFEDGFFHADPHPGNVLVTGSPAAPHFVLLDLGLVGRLSEKLRDLTVDLLVAAVRKDYDSVADILYAIGTPSRRIDRSAFRNEVSRLCDRYLGKSLGEIEVGSVIRDLVNCGNRFGLEIPPDFLLVGRALMTLEGTGRQIAPNLDVFGELGPIFEEVVKKRYTPDRIGLELLRRAEKLGFLAQGLPERADDLLEDLRFGRLSIRTVDPSRSSSNDRFGRRIQIGMLVGSLTLMSALLLAVHRDRLGAAAFALATLTWLGHVGRDFWRSFSDRA